MTRRAAGSMPVTLLTKLDAILVELAVVQPHVIGRLAAEHHLKLGIAEDERVGAVQQRDPNHVLERLGEPRRQLEAAEARAKDHDVLLHRASAYANRGDAGVFRVPVAWPVRLTGDT